MKKLNTINLIFTFAGCFLGAGYVSGQELWQFFGSFGYIGIIGAAISAGLLAAFGILIIRFVQISGNADMDTVVAGNSKNLKILFSVLEIFFLFGILVIMTAGAGALLEEVFSIPQLAGGFIFAVLITMVALIGASGMVATFSVTVPILIIMSIIIFIVKITSNGLNSISFEINASENPLIKSWWISALIFVSYNLFSSIGILTPLGKLIDKKQTVYCGIICGAVALFIIATGIILSLSSDAAYTAAELPMLTLAKDIGNITYYIFAFLLFGGMFGTSVSCVFAIDEYVTAKLRLTKVKRTITIIIITFFSMILSVFGFGKLISIIYPLCGYLGLIALVMIIRNFIKLKKIKGDINEEI